MSRRLRQSTYIQQQLPMVSLIVTNFELRADPSFVVCVMYQTPYRCVNIVTERDVTFEELEIICDCCMQGLGIG